MIERVVDGVIRVVNNTGFNEALKVGFRFDPADPLAVRVRFVQQDGTETEWLVARDVIVVGMSLVAGAAGGADFRVGGWKWPGEVCFCLRSHEGHADISVDRAGLAEFLREARDLVPHNSIDEEQAINAQLDDFLDRLFGDKEDEAA